MLDSAEGHPGCHTSFASSACWSQDVPSFKHQDVQFSYICCQSVGGFQSGMVICRICQSHPDQKKCCQLAVEHVWDKPARCPTFVSAHVMPIKQILLNFEPRPQTPLSFTICSVLASVVPLASDKHDKFLRKSRFTTCNARGRCVLCSTGAAQRCFAIWDW